MSGRFDRQKHLLGDGAMRRLRSATIVVYGVGASGAAVALQLAYLGIGSLAVIDPDRVEKSNLNRQLLYRTSDVGRWKVDAARDCLNGINPTMHVDTALQHDREEMESCIKSATVVVDAVDDYRFKVMLDRSCRDLGVPMIHTSAIGFRGTVVTFADETASYESYFELPSCGRDLDFVASEEFDARRKMLVVRIGKPLYPDELVAEIQSGRVPWQTLVPAPAIAGAVVVSEILRIVLGMPPRFGPDNPYHFDLWGEPFKKE